MRVATLKELRQAAKQGEEEIVVTDVGLARKVRVWQIIRKVAGILVFVILGLAIFAWANPLNIEFLTRPDARLVRQILLGVGIVLLFLEYLLPVVRTYRIAGQDDSGLKLGRRGK